MLFTYLLIMISSAGKDVYHSIDYRPTAEVVNRFTSKEECQENVENLSKQFAVRTPDFVRLKFTCVEVERFEK